MNDEVFNIEVWDTDNISRELMVNLSRHKRAYMNLEKIFKSMYGVNFNDLTLLEAYDRNDEIIKNPNYVANVLRINNISIKNKLKFANSPYNYLQDLRKGIEHCIDRRSLENFIITERGKKCLTTCQDYLSNIMFDNFTDIEKKIYLTLCDKIHNSIKDVIL